MRVGCGGASAEWVGPVPGGVVLCLCDLSRHHPLS